MKRLLIGALLSSFIIPAAIAAEPTTAAMPAAAVDTILGEWVDHARNGRILPYKIYLPARLNSAVPVILFSHGLGGTREGGAYLGRYWAAHGYVSVHLQHAGSDAPSIRAARRAGADDSQRNRASDPGAAIARFEDVPFALDRLALMNRDDPQLRGKFDLTRVAMTGHSYGAHSTLAAAGRLSVTPGGALSFREPRIKVAIALSPAAPRDMAEADHIYRDIRIPILHMTGTLDENPVNAADPITRQVPFRRIDGADQILVVFDGARHDTFGGRRTAEEAPKDPRFHLLIQEATTAFLDAKLRGDAKAKAWLEDGGFKREMGPDGTIEIKHLR